MTPETAGWLGKGTWRIVRAMILRQLTLTILVFGLVASLPACRGGKSRDDSAAAPPDARRPALKTEAELAAEREERLASGEVVDAPTPTVEAEKKPEPEPEPARPAAPVYAPSHDSIRSDILIINNSALTIAEALYPLRDWIIETQETATPRGFEEQLRRRLTDHVRQEIGSLLVYEKATSELADQQRDMLDKTVQSELDKLVSRSHGDSIARFEHYLRRFGLDVDTYRALLEREIVVSSYTREMLAPQIHIIRPQLLEYYRKNINRYRTEATREFLLIALPFAKLLPDDVTWNAATPNQQAKAKLQARRMIREAHEALAERDFADVAREYSRGIHAADGGSWGQIGQPLQPPYREASEQVFKLEPGQNGEPIETETGWYIAGCGDVVEATETPFVDVQEKIRAELEAQRFNKLAGDYIWKLAEHATISDLSGFIDNAVARVMDGNWLQQVDELQ